MVAPSSGFVAHNVCQAVCATATHKRTKRTNMERRRNNCRFYDINDYGDVNGAPWNDVEEERMRFYEDDYEDDDDYDDIEIDEDN